ncbi:unnamed protein product [marine sediment metagenome]|uniref:Uncharacterized protein n=1 Tax=marine sediment metagenome TaxID=412755 RepID=X1BWF9_9ZZZZ
MPNSSPEGIVRAITKENNLSVNNFRSFFMFEREILAKDKT